MLDAYMGDVGYEDVLGNIPVLLTPELNDSVMALFASHSPTTSHPSVISVVIFVVSACLGERRL
jgi:hypothetical protein